MEMPATPCGNDRLERTIVGLNLLEPVMNYDPSGIASLRPLAGTPGYFDRKLAEFSNLDGISPQDRHSKVVTAKVVFLKVLLV